MLNRFVLISLSIILNIFHLYIPASVINYNYDPILSLLSLLVFAGIIFFTSSFRSDWPFLAIISISLVFQNISFYSNGGVPDYINLVVIKSNIPDFFITFTILTWWYYRVYKLSKLLPAKIEQDGS